MAIFGQKPWVNPFEKMSIFRLFEVLVFIGQKGFFSFQNIAKDILLAYIAYKKKVAKMAILATFFLQAIQASRMSFAIFQNEKKPFQPIKTRTSKSRKIDIFSKGLTHGFCPKMAIFPTFFLSNKGWENVFYDTLKRKIAFLDYKNKKFKK